MSKKQTAMSLLIQAAKHPELDELFNRAPPLAPDERIAMLEKLRAERASWGPPRGFNNEKQESEE